MSVVHDRGKPPQIYDRSTTAGIMWTSSLVLAPAAAWGVFRYGVRAALVIAVSLVAALVAEAASAAVLRRKGLRDGHAVLVGLLIAMSMPPTVPLYVPVVAVSFALVVVKWSFGGLGSYWMNPAAAGWVVAYFSFPVAFSAQADAVAGASYVTAGSPAGAAVTAGSPLALALSRGALTTPLGERVTDWLNANVLSFIGVDMPDGYVDLFLGLTPGAIGEGAAFLLLAGTIILFGRRIIRWEIVVSLFVAYALTIRVLGGVPLGVGLFEGDVLFHLFSGGFVLALFFVAPEMGSAPYTPLGMVLFGVAIGLTAAIFRLFGSVPEGIAFAIVLVNVFGPMMNRFTQPRRFGTGRQAGVRRQAGIRRTTPSREASHG
ncbi:MAG: RnfABCDGE type electron transport complex subunit D [Spirochaetales bacterium]